MRWMDTRKTLMRRSLAFNDHFIVQTPSITNNAVAFNSISKNKFQIYGAHFFVEEKITVTISLFSLSIVLYYSICVLHTY